MDDIVIIAVIGFGVLFILILMLSSWLRQKCPSCGKPVYNKEFMDSITIDVSQKKSDGSRDLRYNRLLETETIYKYICKCGHIFHLSEFEEENEDDIIEDNIAQKHEYDKWLKDSAALLDRD